MSDETPAQSCCGMRRKVVVGILGILDEEQCGVGDSEMADFMRFDLATPSGKPILAFRYCPWCGAERRHDDEMRIVELGGPDEGDDDEGDDFS